MWWENKHDYSRVKARYNQMLDLHGLGSITV